MRVFRDSLFYCIFRLEAKNFENAPQSLTEKQGFSGFFEALFFDLSDFLRGDGIIPLPKNLSLNRMFEALCEAKGVTVIGAGRDIAIIPKIIFFGIVIFYSAATVDISTLSGCCLFWLCALYILQFFPRAQFCVAVTKNRNHGRRRGACERNKIVRNRHHSALFIQNRIFKIEFHAESNCERAQASEGYTYYIDDFLPLYRGFLLLFSIFYQFHNTTNLLL